ncbi:MAG: aminopeptidase P family protein [Bacteroidales bacterium]|nr:aminopeptidase P family protein [Bacteroidales bacterium]
MSRLNPTDYKARVEALRRWLRGEGLNAYVVPTLDPHNSEYLPFRWQTREWLTGFTGSAGLAVVTLEKAALWTDSRYFLQAEEQLAGTGIELMREGTAGTPEPTRWIEEQLQDGDVVGFCGECMSKELFDSLFADLSDRIAVRVSENDPFDYLWRDRPDMPRTLITLFPEAYAGLSAREKLQAVRDALPAVHGGAERLFLMNDLSEIAWTLNLRGGDIDFNPLFLAYLLITDDKATLFVDRRKLTEEVRTYLSREGVAVDDYNAWQYVAREVRHAGRAVSVYLPASVNMAQLEAFELATEVADDVRLEVIPSPVPPLRAVKTEAEREGMRTAMLRDGAAMVQFLRWLDEEVPKGLQSEVSIDKKLTALRAEQPGFKGLSFPTIAGYAAHGAIVHYEATEETAARLEPRGLLLLDSGAHYDCGTTDITRTVALGSLTEEERRVYTLVLKGHINLARARFPEGTTGLELDLAARYGMWQRGYDFGHGTGHGVGTYLGVHEGPHQIRKNCRACTLVPFADGMTVTDEPGIYVSGRFGVRIENVLLAREDGATDFGKFLAFETLTLCPIDLRPVEKELLTDEEIAWLNAYHDRVRAALLPLLANSADKDWLEAATRHI